MKQLGTFKDNINTPSARHIKGKKHRAQLDKIQNEKGEITAHTTGLQRVRREYCELLHILHIF